MSIELRLQALRARHAALEQEIQCEIARPAFDSVAVSVLKRRKLQIKEEIDRLAH